VTELAGQGDDTIFSGVTYTLPDNVENIALIGAGNTLAFGNSLDNRLVGNNGKNALIGGGGNDTLDGKGGTDSMFGGAGDDTYYVDSALDSVTELANRGVDTVHSKVSYTLGAHVENLILIGSARIDGRGNAAANFLVGNTSINTLSGRAGNDILQGLDGNDVLSAAGGHTVFDGGGGADAITGGAGNEMFIGGIGNDTISTGAGADIIAFNVGDGRDLVTSGTGADNVLSIGGGIDYAALTFTKSGNNLIMKTAGADQITFKNWYSGPNNRSVARLQVFTEAMPGYDQHSADPLLNNKVEQFNFAALANAFDAAGQVSGWALTNALLSAHLSGSDTEAIGGDLAYQYGKSGSLSGIGLAPAQDVINAPEFGSSAQALRTPPELQQGQTRLS
jgi:Ca2+-binding RTX toxin-like protein